MPKIAADDRISAAGRAAQDLGAAALFGGNVFARVGMHPAQRAVSKPRERGQVVNAAWRRYGAVNSVSLLSILAGWGVARIDEASDAMLSERERRLARAKDAAVGVVAVTGIASAVVGMRFAHMEPDGAVKLADGSTPSSHTPPGEARAKRALDAIGAAHTVASGALVALNSALSQSNFRRPPTRRLLRRDYRLRPRLPWAGAGTS